MTKNEVIKLLKENQNQRGIDNWNKMKNTAGLKSYGIGLTQLRKLAKKVGRSHELSLELWETDIYDAKTIALLIDEPKKITKEQAESQVEGVGAGLFAHVFSSCDATLAKSPIAFDLANEWLATGHELRRRCGYGLLYELSKNKRNKSLTDEYFLQCIEDINGKVFNVEETPTMRCAMGGALMGIGKRNKVLNKRAIEVAKAVGPIDFNEDGGKCEPLDVLKHLTNESLQKKLA
ncbi:MAG: DNA alkylation repair protein [Kangiellaceae bacterium]|nr:DNA alkylation repair protein [Kangiellaceae bacterium]MCW8999814.1 DNA alkylation repair protein [Kangiellaceae bacterium]